MRGGLLFAVTLAACAARTEVVVGLATDLSVPQQLDTVELFVLDTLGREALHQSFPLPSSHLPGSIGLVDGGGLRSGFHVVVRGERTVEAQPGGPSRLEPFVTREAQLGFVAGKTLFLRMELSAACYGQRRFDACPRGQACLEGRCQPIAVDPASLPEYAPDDELHAQCGAPGFGLTPAAHADCPSGSTCREATCVTGGKAALEDSAAALDATAMHDLSLADDLMVALEDSGLDLGAAALDLAAPVDGGATDLRAARDSVAAPDLVPLADLASPPACQHQWTTTTRFFSLSGVWGSSAADVYVVGDYDSLQGGAIAHSVDGGSTWKSIDVDGGNASLHAIWGSGPSDLYVAGTGSVIFHSTDGTTWVPTTIAASFGRIVFHALWGKSDGALVYATDDSGDVFTSADHGRTWTYRATGTAASLDSAWGDGAGSVYLGGAVWGTSRADVLAFSTSAGLPIVTSDGGNTFIPSANASGKLWRYDGAVWSELGGLSSIPSPNLVAGFNASPSDLRVLHVDPARTAAIWRTTDGGQTFSKELTLLKGTSGGALWGSGACDVYAVAGNGSGIIAHYH